MLGAFVLAAIQDNLLANKMEQRVRDAITKAKRQAAKGASREHRKLQDLRRKIERGTENLALADKNEFKAISALLARWQAEETELAMRIERPYDDLEPLPEALKILKRLPEIRKNIGKADSGLLKNAIAKTITSFTVSVRDTQAGEIR